MLSDLMVATRLLPKGQHFKKLVMTIKERSPGGVMKQTDSIVEMLW